MPLTKEQTIANINKSSMSPSQKASVVKQLDVFNQNVFAPSTTSASSSTKPTGTVSSPTSTSVIPPTPSPSTSGGGTPTPTTTNNVDVSTLTTPQVSPTVPTGTSLADTTHSFVGDTTASFLQGLDTQAGADVTAAQAKLTPIEEEIKSLGGQMAGKGAETIAAEQAAGIPQMSKQLADLKTQIQQKTQAYNQGLLDIEGKPIPMQFITGQQAQLNKQKALDIGSLVTAAQVLQGNMQAAQDTADRMVDLKYADIQTALNNEKDLYSQNYDLLSTAQKNQADIRSKEITARMQNIKDQAAQDKQDQKDNLSMIQNAQALGVPQDNLSKALDVLKKGGSPIDVAEALGQYSGKPQDKVMKEAVYDDNGNKIGEKIVTINPLTGKSTTTTSPSVKSSAYTSTGTGTVTPAKFSLTPDAPTAANGNQVDPVTGLTLNAIYQDALIFASNDGKMPSLGLGSKPKTVATRNAIQNKAGAIAAALGLTIPVMQQLYKAKGTAMSQVVQRVAKIETTSKTLQSQFPRLIELAKKVGSLSITEQDLTAGKAHAMQKFGSVDAANYIELINTVRGDYSSMQASIAGSRGGQYFSETAAEAIPTGLTPEQYKGIQDTITQSADLANQSTQGEVQDLLSSSWGTTDSGTSYTTKDPTATSGTLPDGVTYTIQ